MCPCRLPSNSKERKRSSIAPESPIRVFTRRRRPAAIQHFPRSRSLSHTLRNALIIFLTFNLPASTVHPRTLRAQANALEGTTIARSGINQQRRFECVGSDVVSTSARNLKEDLFGGCVSLRAHRGTPGSLFAAAPKDHALQSGACGTVRSAC